MIVQSTCPAGEVCLWERHEAHPGGEVFIADNAPHEVGDTPAVRDRLKKGRLVEVKPESLMAPPPEPESEPKPKRRR